MLALSPRHCLDPLPPRTRRLLLRRSTHLPRHRPKHLLHNHSHPFHQQRARATHDRAPAEPSSTNSGKPRASTTSSSTTTPNHRPSSSSFPWGGRGSWGSRRAMRHVRRPRPTCLLRDYSSMIRTHMANTLAHRHIVPVHETTSKLWVSPSVEPSLSREVVRTWPNPVVS